MWIMFDNWARCHRKLHVRNQKLFIFFYTLTSKTIQSVLSLSLLIRKWLTDYASMLVAIIYVLCVIHLKAAERISLTWGSANILR